MLALLLRLTFGVFLLPEEYRSPGGDAKEYDRLAMNLVAGKGLTDGTYYSQRMPLYPFFLAAVYAVFGHRTVFVGILQSVLGALMCVLVYKISQLLFSERIAVLSGFLVSVYFPFIYFSYYGGPAFLLSENLLSFFLALFVLYASKIVVGHETRGAFFLLGIALGACLLTRSDILFVVLMTPLWILFVSKGSIRERILKGLLVTGITLATLLPWGIRNYLIHGEVVFLSTKSGATFFDGNNLRARGGGVWVHSNPADWPEGFDRLSELEKDRALFQEGLNFLRSHLNRVPWLVFRKFLVHWSPWIQGEARRREYNWAYLLLAPFVAAGTFRMMKMRKWRELSLFLYLFFGSTLAAIIVFGDPRYRYPYEPYWVILAAVGLEGGVRFLEKARFKREMGRVDVRNLRQS